MTSPSIAEDVADIATRYLLDPPNGSEPVINAASPSEVLEAFEATVGLGFGENAKAHRTSDLRSAVDLVVGYSARTSHPRFMNQNFAGPDPVSVAGDWLGAALNTTAATYEAAPVFTLMETAILHKLARFVGYPSRSAFGADPAGIFCPGGSTATLYGLQLARHRRNPDMVKHGVGGEPQVIFVSESGHYSAVKSAILLGMGADAVVKVRCDEAGAIDIQAFDEAVCRAKAGGLVPLAAIGTAGTTVTSAFDDLGSMADICEREQMWFHVDGCYGGSALASPRHAYRLSGVERSDSMVWNLHKMMGATQQCTALLVRASGELRSCFALEADYLFQPDKQHGEYDLGDLSFQCARRVDAFKAWLQWKTYGDEGMAERIDHAVELADYARNQIQAGDGRFALIGGEFTNVVFLWVPPEYRPFGLTAASDEQRNEIHRLAPAIKAKMMADGGAMVGYQPVSGVNAFRILLMNPAVKPADIDAVLDLIDRCGNSVL